jgi:hypothetical protein
VAKVAHTDRAHESARIANPVQLAIGLAAILAGTLIYLVLRSPEQIYFTRFFGIHAPLFDVQSPLLRIFGQRLPAFFHVLAFALITASFFRNSKRTYFIVCTGWLAVNGLFELGQKYKDFAVRLVPDAFEKIPFLETTRRFFLFGTFDGFDLAAALSGAVAAYFILIATSKR